MRALTVDWWHTLAEPVGGDWEAFSKGVRTEGIREELLARGVDVDLPTLQRAYDLWTASLADVWRRHVDWGPGRQVRELLAHAGVDDVGSDVLEAVGERIGSPLLERPPRIHEGAAETLRALKERGVRLAIVSNTGRTWGRFLRTVQARAGLGDLFDHRTFSDEEEVRKPAAAIFTRTLDALGVAPGETAHIGDDVDADVRGARAVGVRAIWYDTGFWKGATAPDADAVVHAWDEVPDVFAGW